MDALPEPTERLLYVVDRAAVAEGLVLAGGTALALRIAHRRSGDLDFVLPAKRLPRKRLARLIDSLRRSHSVAHFPDVAAEQEFFDSGLELADFQQDYSIDGVKVTFFVPDATDLAGEISGERGVAGLKRVLVADLRSLFLMKAVALSSRMTLRDLFDGYTLIEHHGFRAAELFDAADRFGRSAEVLKARLLYASRRADDPGIEVVTGSAPTFDQLKAYFAEVIDGLEQAEAEGFTKKRRSKRRPS